MEYRITTGVAIEEVAKHFAWFFPSLQNYPKEYLHLIFTDPANAPSHHAYMCPMCLRNGLVLIDKDLKISSVFSHDHFPPKSVGGFHTMLVCKNCNSEAGAEVDFALKEQINRISLENRVPLSTVKAVTTITRVPGNYKGTFSINKEGEAILGFNAEGKTNAIFLNNWLQDPGKDWEASIVIRNPDVDKVAKALVRAAYLFCFGVWGYEFAFSVTGQMIRRYLAGECQYPVKSPITWLGSILNSNETISMPVGLCQIQRPIEAKCFLVNIVLTNQETGFKEIAAVAIPHPKVSGWEDLGKQQEVFNRLYESKAPVIIGHADKYTLQKGFHDGYRRSWEYLTEL